MKYKILLLLTLLFLLVSCQQELLPIVGGSGKDHISFHIAAMKSSGVISLDDVEFKSINSKGSAMTDDEENAVKSIDMVFFDAVNHTYITNYTQKTVDISNFNPILPSNVRGRTCNIYFLANLQTPPTGFTTEDEFKRSSCGFTALIYYNEVYSIPMFGSLLNYNIPNDGIITNAPVTLTRLLARIDVRYSNTVPTTALTVQSLQLCNVPNITPYYIPSTVDAAYYDYSGVTMSNLYPNINPYSSTVTYYVPANRRGEDKSISDPRLKNGVGITNPTYVEIKGTNVAESSSLSYIFYLGGNNTYDYNILPNTKYTVNASIKGISSVDSRIVKIQPESNCYMVKPGSTIYIPVSRAIAANTALIDAGVTGTGFTSLSTFTAGLLWSDVSTSHVTTSVVGRNIKVTASSTEGNSVVYAKMGATIVWSWHIWVTNYAPSVTARPGVPTATGGTIVTYNTRYWLDRNLGAAAAGTNFTAYGLFYQWGRKDPFPTNDITVGDFPFTKSISGPVSCVTAINNPNNFYPNMSSPYDWNSLQSNTSWNSATNGKTIYDPCPVGYRVPLNTYFSGAFANNTLAGSRVGANGQLSSGGSLGCYWSCTPTGTNAFNFISGSGTSNAGRANGYSVRCVQE